MILYLTGLNAISPDQIEAGRLDGAKGWRMLWHVGAAAAAAGDVHRRRWSR